MTDNPRLEIIKYFRQMAEMGETIAYRPFNTIISPSEDSSIIAAGQESLVLPDLDNFASTTNCSNFYDVIKDCPYNARWAIPAIISFLVWAILMLNIMFIARTAPAMMKT
jgi:hypothetical protein